MELTDEQKKLAEQGNSIGMKFTLIPAGEFDMGSEEFAGERPVHRVKIYKPFYLGTYPVTQAEWKAVTGDDPSYFKGDRLPVDMVAYDDIREFISKLNRKEGTYLHPYRLPSEAEWEYACRAGTTTKYSFGDSESKFGDYEWCWGNTDHTQPVGEKKPNPWGLYDMQGNIREWVEDAYHRDYDGAPTDGSAWEIRYSNVQVFRGGAWSFSASYCRSTIRNSGKWTDRSSDIGFRLLKEL